VPFDSEDVALELRRWRADVIDFSIRGGSLTDGETHSADNDKGTGEGVRSWKPLRVWGSDESPQFSLYGLDEVTLVGTARTWTRISTLAMPRIFCLSAFQFCCTTNVILSNRRIVGQSF
jgi:hypothetical protein